ncbi:hypothetical protein ASPZODRAFT_128040 [Penicilliopsis zonata CBS 506.65]|uniref:Peptidase S54 rhomboid domain-containing protein n=1 Tax=Penicilliopsis zonata CBS 506.65 TaxID=1073090 RepID=A0A1L9SQP4_9EURO|nr:hypothetical protein ASPZODRAFT_128040 [Penicilliopsis zonata CBS 506.65]OJJ49552.1 hypothetical protein ASPZODRAFT_128040 [Penicilliopsis zonata CBS 506.65]
MSNAFGVAWRIPCPGLCASSLLPSSTATTLRSAWPAPRTLPSCAPWRLYSTASRPSFVLSNTALSIPSRFLTPSIRPYKFSHSLFNWARSEPEPAEPEYEHGVPIRQQPLSAAEINAIFGKGKVSPEVGNRLLAVVQGRRLAGTIDLDLPSDLVVVVRESTFNTALKWLRAKYPVDEDAAILARFEREEREEEEKLVRRAEKLGLYKPQSGTYGAERGENNSPYGKSVLNEVREYNEAKILKEEEQKRQEWLEGELKDQELMKRQLERNTALQKFEENAVVEARPRADPSQRPVLAWIQKHHLQATEKELDPKHMNMSTSRRILPSLILTFVTIGLGCLFAEYYQPPMKNDRLWPNVPPAAATILTIAGLNASIFLLWKFPPAWRMLNKYFISLPLVPRPFSILGSVFSHQTVKHLAMNMAILWFMGTKVHDEIGRGNFLALYMASGAFGSMASLAARVLTGNLVVTSLGASGAISGVVAAWCILHTNDKLVLWFVPYEWQNTFAAPGWVFLAGIVAFEVASVLSPIKFRQFDYMAHLGGYFAGAVWAALYNARREKKRKQEMTWWDKVGGTK